MSRTKSTCGAISGALMAIGLASGRDHADEDRAPSYALGSQLIEEFRQKFGTDNCFDLTGLDFGTSEGQEDYKKRVHEEVCVKAAQFAAVRAVELITEQTRAR
jgi:C_GCAxxG_C_C family probable redox protein